MSRMRLSPVVVVVALILVLAIIAGAYLVLSGRRSATPKAPEVKDDPYANQYNAPPRPAASPDDAVAAPTGVR